MKSIVFDTGPLISLAINNLLRVLSPLKKQFGGNFYITSSIKEELVDRPLTIKRFEFEALRVLEQIRNNTLQVVESKRIDKLAKKLLDISNSIFMARGNIIKIVHYAEMQALAAAISLNSEVLVVDERTTRLLVDNPQSLGNLLGNKLHTKISTNRKNLNTFLDITEKINVIRSVELVTMAFEMGLLDKYLPNVENSKRILLDAVLWGVKLNGCAVSKNEIERIKKIEL